MAKKSKNIELLDKNETEKGATLCQNFILQLVEINKRRTLRLRREGGPGSKFRFSLFFHN